MMKCIYCGEELKEGSLYCPKCGKAVQIVPDYNIYDDDYLNQVLTEESQKISGSGPDRNKKPAPAETKHPLWQNCILKKTIMIRHLFYIRK